MTTGRINQVTAFQETTAQPKLHNGSDPIRLSEGIDRRLSKRNGYLAQAPVGRGGGQEVQLPRCPSECSPSSSQRPESVEEQTARTRSPTQGRLAGGVIIHRLSAGRALVLANAQPARPEREWIAHRTSS